MKLIPLTRGLFAKVDDADFDELSKHRWRACVKKWTVYAVANVRGADGEWKTVKMHRLLLGFPAGLEIDHADGDGLNNQRLNLRKATRAQNARNRHKAVGKSRFLGVHRTGSHSDMWSSSICCDGAITPLGRFGTEEEAARAYDAAASRLFGEFANLNFPANETEKGAA